MSRRSAQASAAPNEAAVRQQLQRILASDAFASAPVLQRFLSHVVEHGLREGDAPLKEYSIGVDVLGRGADFDPRVDTIVRVHARRLRSRLNAYYTGPGRDDPVRISIPKGHYVADVAANAGEATARATVTTNTGIASAGTRPRAGSHLPAPRTSFVGREGDVTAVCEWLRGDATRLLTLTGVGGSGKTRLALAACSALDEAFPGGLFFVGLSDVPDASAMELAIARTLRVPLVDGSPVSEAIVAHLRRTTNAPLLLVLDNFEHLVRAAPGLGVLLDGCEHLRTLVTSRVPLRIYGEAEYPVAPLPVPGDDPQSPDALRGFPAVELFVQRAAAASPSFRLDDANADAVSAVCRMLDGLPLAIELVAAHVRELSPRDIVSGVVPHLDLPARNVQDVPDRQRTLRSAIGWSHHALPPPAQVLFRRISAFAGSFTLEAARAISSVGTLPEIGMDVAEALAKLLDASLVQADTLEDEHRFSMLETIRAYGREQLDRSGESVLAYRALAAYGLVLAEEGNQRMSVAAREAWLSRCDLEHGNFHVALEAMLEHGWDEMALRLGAALNGYWERREYIAEGNRMLGLILERARPEADPEAWANIAYCNGGFADVLGRHAQAIGYYQAMLRMRREAGDRKGEAIALNAMAFSDIFRAQYDDALAHMRQAQALWDALGDAQSRAAGLSNLANVYLVRGEHADARERLLEAIDLFEREDDRSSVAWCLSGLGDVERECHAFDEAEAQYRRAYELFVGEGDYWGVARTWGDMGHVAIARGRFDLAAGLFRDALEAFRRLDYRRGVATTIDGCARLAVARDDPDGALLLAGAAEAVRRSVHVVVMPYIHQQVAAELEPARQALGEERAQAQWRRGAALPLREAIDAATASVSPKR
jgi:predicted ATPase